MQAMYSVFARVDIDTGQCKRVVPIVDQLLLTLVNNRDNALASRL